MKKFRRFLKKLVWVFIGAGCLLTVGIAVLYIYAGTHLPNVEKLKDVHLQVPLRIYSADNLLIGQFGTKRRTPVSLEKIPKPLIDAVLATEDARFYQHSGVDMISIIRAAIAVVTSGKKVQGASTITMQVARNFYLSSEKTYIRKIKEILLALKIDKEISKDTILELYLNKIYFGYRAYGVVAAAKTYYGKSLDELTLAQMAMIAGLPQAPSRNNPLANPDAALKRRNHVLLRMKEIGAIDEAQYQAAIAEADDASFHHDRIQLSAPYVAEMVRQKMVEQYGEEVYEQGLSVYTTVRSSWQIAARDALRKGLLAFDKRHEFPQPEVQGALVALQPNDGAIGALVGGFDYETTNFNRAVQAERQTGSSFKPFIYSAALNKGMTLATIINDAPIVQQDSGENKLWRPNNDNFRFYGPTPLRMGFIKSRNLISIRLLQTIGIGYTLDYLKRFGFDSDGLPHSLSLALGSGLSTPLDVARGYAVFANGGYLKEPYLIEKIVNQKGEIVFHQSPALALRVISEQNAYLMTQAMRDVIQRGTGRGAKILKRDDIAGKTGTTNDQADAWFSGFNSDVVATVWVGFDDMRSLHEFAVKAALPIWIDFMRDVLRDTPQATMPEPAGIVRARIDPATGLLAPPEQPNAIFEIFEQGTVPQQYSDVTVVTHDTITEAPVSDFDQASIF